MITTICIYLAEGLRRVLWMICRDFGDLFLAAGGVASKARLPRLSGVLSMVSILFYRLSRRITAAGQAALEALESRMNG